MASTRSKRAHGQLRRSQVITTFGPGAMVDLPTHAVIVGGLETWGDPDRLGFQAIREERLLAKLRRLLGNPGLRLFAPPMALDEAGAPHTGMTAWQFPEWFVSELDEPQDPPVPGVRSRRLLNIRDLVSGRYLGPDKRRHPVVPIRFVQACLNGHIDDVDWHGFVHGYEGTCRGRLWLDEREASGDFADIFVRCECTQKRSLASALSHEEEKPPLGFCRGKRPWLGLYASEACRGESGAALPNRLLVRSASNAYFSQVVSAISIPESDAVLRRAVDAVYEDFLVNVEELGDLRYERRKAKVAAALDGLTDEAIFDELMRRKRNLAPPDKSIKQAEMETLLAQRDEVGEDVPESDFYARALPLPPVEARTGPMRWIERVVLVHRLREVQALVGFTRFEPIVSDIDAEHSLDVRRAAIARETTWLPAVENHGEGFLLVFDREKLDAWAGSNRLKPRAEQLRAGFDQWKKAHPRSKAEYPGPRYILLHSLSHLLITAVSLACGYAASSIRERIYVTEAGCGILLYTGTADAEGTLGGLIQVGRDIEEHLRHALELGALCSNDPICAEHRPDNAQEERFLQGAACHGCLLIAEPSCERRNEYLDRALVVSTVAENGAELFCDTEG